MRLERKNIIFLFLSCFLVTKNILPSDFFAGIPLYHKIEPEVKETLDEIKIKLGEATNGIKEAPTQFAKKLDKPELDLMLKLWNGTPEERKKAADDVAIKTKEVGVLLGNAMDRHNVRTTWSPSPWYLARYGFIFGAAVFAGFNGLYYVQQMVKDYLAIRKPKYISPLSHIGVFDQYKQLIKIWFYGFKQHKHDDEAQIIVDRLENLLLINDNEKKQFNNFFIRDNLAHDNTRLFGAVAQKLDMDFIAIPSINLLQKNNIVEIWNELVQIIHKNNRPVILYIDQAELLSMDGTEYSEREDNIKVLASCVKSCMAVFKSKCMIVGLSRNKEDLEGPFTEIFTQQFVL